MSLIFLFFLQYTSDFNIYKQNPVYTLYTEKEGLVSNDVKDLCFDSFGTLYAITNNSLSYKLGHSWKSVSYLNDNFSILKRDVILFTSEGDFYYSFLNSLFNFDGKSWKNYSNICKSLYEEISIIKKLDFLGKERLIVATNLGNLYYLDQDEWIQINIEMGVKILGFSIITNDIIVITENSLYKYNLASEVLGKLNFILDAKILNSKIIDNSVYLTIEKKGLFKYDLYSEAFSNLNLISNESYDLIEIKNDSSYVLANSKNLLIVYKYQIYSYQFNETFKAEIRDISLTPDHNITLNAVYVATSNGVYRFQLDNFTVRSLNNYPNLVLNKEGLKTENIIFGATQNQGFYTEVNSKIQFYNSSNSNLKSDKILTFYQFDRQNYIITNLGMQSFTENKLLEVPELNNVLKNKIVATAKSDYGDLYLALEYQGLIRFKDDEFKFISDTLFETHLINGISLTGKQNTNILWIATQNGLVCYDGRFNLIYQNDEKLAGNVNSLTSFRIKDKNYLALGISNKGLQIIPLNDLNKIESEEKWVSLKFANNNQIKTILSQCFSSATSELFFADSKRVYSINLDSLLNDNLKIETVLDSYEYQLSQFKENALNINNDLLLVENQTNLLVKNLINKTQNINFSLHARLIEDGKNYELGKNVNIRSSDLFLEMDWLNHSLESANFYKVTLNKNQNLSNWQSLNQRNIVNVPYGKNMLDVEIKDASGNTFGPYSYSFTIITPIYFSIYAKIIYGIICLLILYFIYKLKTRQLKNKNLKLEIIVQERTHDLKTANIELHNKNSQLEYTAIKLKETLDVKNELLGMAAHDLKNPLSSVIGFSKVLIDTFPTLDDKEKEENLKDYLSIINDSSIHMLEIIDITLAKESLEFGNLKLNSSQFSLSHLAESCLKSFELQFQKKKLKCQKDIRSNIELYADELKIREILDNLISNALKYSFLEKEIFIKVSYEEFEHMNYAAFSIKDQGPGLTEEDKTKLFTKYQKLSAKPTGGESSTGLGLSIVNKLIQLHNGKIWVFSELGLGCEFKIIIPIK